MQQYIDQITLWVRESFFQHISDEQIDKFESQISDYTVFVIEELEKKGINLEKICFEDIEKLFVESKEVEIINKAKNIDPYADNPKPQTSITDKVQKQEGYLIVLGIIVLVIGVTVIRKVGKWGLFLILASIVYALTRNTKQFQELKGKVLNR